MQLNSFYQICIFFTIGLFVFSLGLNFMIGLHLFGDMAPVGITPGANSDDTFSKITGGLGMNAIWGIVLTISGFGAVALAILTQSATFVGIYIFSVVFWASYLNALGIINAFGLIPITFIGLFTVPLIFIFAGAIIGMLSGV